MFEALGERAELILEAALADAPPDLDALVRRVGDCWLDAVELRVDRDALLLGRAQARGVGLATALGPDLALELARRAGGLFRRVAEDGGRASLGQFRFNGLAPRQRLAERALRGLQRLLQRHAGSYAQRQRLKAALRRAWRGYLAAAPRDFAQPFLRRALAADAP